MSRIFSGTVLALITSPQPRPITLGGRLGQAVPISVNWLAYGAGALFQNLILTVDLGQADVQAALKQIRSIYIDNMGSDTPIYVNFPSTDYTIVAQPNSAGWFRVYTSDLKFFVIGQGFVVGDIPITKLTITNVDINPSVDLELQQAVALWKASATITRGSTIYNQNLGTPALGDQIVSYNPGFTVPSVIINNLWGTPYSSGFIYLTMMDISSQAIGTAGGGQGSFVALIESTGVAGLLLNFLQNDAALANGIFGPRTQILSHDGMNIKLDATQTWRMRTTTVQNDIYSIFATFCFTLNPT